MNTRFLRLVQLSVFGLDLIALNILILLLQWGMPRVQTSGSLEYAQFWMWLNASWLIVTIVGNLYNEKYIASFEVFSRRTMHAYFYWLILVLVYLFFTRQLELSRLYILFVLTSQGGMLLMNRFIYLGVRGYFRQNNYLTRKVMILGYNETAKKLVSYLEEDGRYTEIVGFCEEEENVQELTNYPIVAPVRRTIDVSKLLGVEEIYSTIAPEQDRGIYRVMQEADRHCIRFKVIPDMSYFMNRTFHVDYLNDIPVLSVRKEPLDDAGNRIKKRLFDIVVSGLVCLTILPWMIPIIGILIWIESPGPIFFKQQRTGKNNKPFLCLKFRSMKVNREANARQATRNDSRLTRIGKVLRKTNLDEFPQFLNVLRGDMSIVGPRPHMLKHTDDYSKLIDEYMVRQFVKPGVTGWAQVNGYRGETRTLEQMQGRVNHDLWYAENWSLWLDIRIMFLTVYTTIKGDKNAF